MNTITRKSLVGFALAALGCIGPLALAQNTAPPAPQVERPQTERPQVETPDRPADAKRNAAPAADAHPDANVDAGANTNADANTNTHPDANADDDEPEMTWDRARHRRPARTHTSNHDEMVSFGSDATLEADRRADTVVSILGSSTSAGIVNDSVVSVLGNTRVEGGSVGEAAVAVVGDNYVNANIDGDVVTVLGNAELGPKADVRGKVVVVGGALKRDPAAHVGGGVQRVMTMPVGALAGLRSWIDNCARYLRPLAFAPGLGWAWTFAIGFLALYAIFGLVFREPMDRCVKTLQEQPGQTILASLLAMILTPVLFVILVITVIGAVFVPIAGFAIFLATLFGKAVVLAWIGRSLLKFLDDGDKLSTGLAVLAGGAIMLLLYTVPVLGFIIYNLLGFLAFGVVVYTLLLAAQARRKTSPPPGVTPGSSGPTPAAAGAGFSGGGAAYMAGASGGADATTAADGLNAAGASAPGSAGTQGFAAGADAPAGGTPGAGGTQGHAPGAGAPGGAYPPPGAQPAVNEAFTLPRAGFWIRILALLIDTVLIGIALRVLSHTGQLHLVALATYGAIMWKLKGTTVGGIVCNLKVVRTDGRPMDWPTAVIRALGCFLSLIVCGLGFIWIAFDEGRQSWHDKIAGTAVVRSPQGVSLI